MLHRHPFVKAVAGPLRERCGVEPGDRIVLAVSGGADSVALVCSLAALAARPHWSLELHVAHVHHGLRDGADADEEFVRELADGLGLPFHRKAITPGMAAGNLEANARRMRYGALAEVAAETGADAVAAAHHADDQLETLLMRLIRGASAEGLSGMAPRRRLNGCGTAAPGCAPALIRPMLSVDHAAAVAFLQEIDQPWREDPTNADRSCMRARLRADVLPVLRDLKPDAARKAAQTADQLRESGRLVRGMARRAERRHITIAADGRSIMSRETARRLPHPLLTTLIRRRCQALGGRGDALGHRAIAPIVRAAQDGSGETRVFTLAGGVRAEVTAEAVAFSGG